MTQDQHSGQRFFIRRNGECGFTVHDRQDYGAMVDRFDTWADADDWIDGRKRLASLSGIYRVARRFYDDHVARDLPAGELLRETKLVSVVRLNGEDYLELLSDASHYADDDAEIEDEQLVRSARSVKRALAKAGPPTEPAIEVGSRWLWVGATWRVDSIKNGTALIVNVDREFNTARLPLTQFNAELVLA